LVNWLIISYFYHLNLYLIYIGGSLRDLLYSIPIMGGRDTKNVEKHWATAPKMQVYKLPMNTTLT